MSVDINLPRDWKIKKLGEVCSSPQYGYTTSGSKTGNVKLLRTTDITSGKIEWEKVPFCKDNPKEIEKYLLHDGDIVISRAGSVGVSYLLRKPERSVFASYLIRFKPNHEIISTDYFFHFLQSPIYWNEISEKSLGIAVPNVNATKLKDIPVPIPPLQEQHFIVSKIEELLSDLENGKQQLQIAQQQLKVYRQSLLKWAFEGRFDFAHRTEESIKEGELPKGWKILELKEVCEIKRGKSKHRPRNEPSLFGGDFPFIQTGDIRNANGGYIRKYSQTYNEKGLQQSKLWVKGTLCITIAANIGETAILGIDACFPDSVVGLVCNEQFLLNKYANYFFISHKSKLEELAPATAQKNINVDILEKVKIPIPSLEEQQFIVNELESKLTVCDKIEETITQSLQQAETLRQSILKKAFEGKLVDVNELKSVI